MIRNLLYGTIFTSLLYTGTLINITVEAEQSPFDRRDAHATLLQKGPKGRFKFVQQTTTGTRTL